MAQKISSKLVAIGAVAALSFGLAACGDDGADRAPKGEFLQGIKDLAASQGYDEATLLDAGLTQEQIDGYYQCIADNSYEELSDEFVTAVAEGNENASMESDDSEVINSAVEDCVAKMSE